MLCIGIHEDSQRMARIICPALSKNGFELIYCTDGLIDIPKNNSGKALLVISGSLIDTINTQLDICILSEENKEPPLNCKASVVITPETANAQKINALSPKSVISYGICSKNTITVSSLIESNLIISIQRELVSLSGERIEEQELQVVIENTNDTETVLACIAILILVDVPIESIKGMAFN